MDKIEKNAVLHPLSLAEKMVYDKCGFEVLDLKINSESVAYGACSFVLNGFKIVHRVSKITPTKVGQFVSIWQRNKEGKTVPLDVMDNFDFLIITSVDNDKIGQFIFPKSLLLTKGIISNNGLKGKNGIRVYPPWDKVLNQQAMQSQRWQIEYFLNIEKPNLTNFDLFK
jgi:hypothetical protein